MTGGDPAERPPAASQPAYPQCRGPPNADLSLQGASSTRASRASATEVGHANCQEGGGEDLPSTRPPPYPLHHVALAAPWGWGRHLTSSHIRSLSSWWPVPLMRFPSWPFVFQGTLLDPGETHRAESQLHTQTQKPPLCCPPR